MSSINYIQDGQGSTFIPATQRPDGTWRRPIRVRDGYVPQEEQPLYVSKGRQEKSPYPVGLSASDVSERSKSGSGKASSALYFEIGNYTPIKTTTIPGLNFVKDDTEVKTVPKKKKRSKTKSTSEETPGAKAEPSRTNQVTSAAVPASQQPNPDPVKRLRNLRKKLKDIEALEVKIKKGELQNPEKDQLEKINRKDEVEEEIEELQALVESLNL